MPTATDGDVDGVGGAEEEGGGYVGDGSCEEDGGGGFGGCG